MKRERIFNCADGLDDSADSTETELELFHSIFRNLSYYIFLIDRDFHVVYTNYFDLNTNSEQMEPMILGNVLRCNNAIESGHCGTHNMCRRCIIRASLESAFRTGEPVPEVEAHLRLFNKQKAPIDTDVTVAAKVVDIDNKRYLVVCVRDITTFKALQRRFIKNEYRLNSAIRQTEVYLNLIRSITSSLDGKLTAMKSMSKKEDDDFSSLEMLEKYSTPISSALPQLMVFCNSDTNYSIIDSFLGRSYRLLRTKTFDDSLMIFLNSGVKAVIIASDISLNEANMLSDVVHCSAGYHPVLRLVGKGNSPAGTYDDVLEEPFSQEQLEKLFLKFDLD